MIDFLESVYAGRTVLVTGDTGFKGGWLCLWLQLLGARVIGYALRPPTEPNLFDTIGLAGGMVHIDGDVRDHAHLESIFSRHQPQIVFHLAAQPLVRLSYREPLLTYETNIMGTVNVLEAVRHTSSVRAVVSVTSDKCYENLEWVWPYRENDPLGGRDPYSSSKASAELVTSAYLRSFFSPEQYGETHEVALASARAGNVIGGGDWGEDRLLPDCVRALSRDEQIILRSPKAIRPWQYVLDPLSGYLLLGAKLWHDGAVYSGPWNFGPTDFKVWDVEQMVQGVIHLWGKGSCRMDDDKRQPHESHWLKLDSSKAKMALGWSAQCSVERALDLTVSWYRHFYEGASPEKMKETCIRQIRLFMHG